MTGAGNRPTADGDRTERIVIVGGGLAAARTASALRRAGFAGSITMLAAEPHLPYDRPPLSKAVLKGVVDDTTLRFDHQALEVDVRCGVPATGLDLAGHVVHTPAGEVSFDKLVVATGARPVRLPGDAPQATLRSIDDARALRGNLVPGARVVIVGASWIGAEVATAALDHGCHVTCVEAGPAPLAQALGEEIGASLVPWWEGADLRLGATVAQIHPDGVDLADGSHLPADLVVCGVGVRPDTTWLEGSGLEIDRGVVVDEHLRTSDPSVVAVGDVAARWSPRYGARLRVEHWEDAAGAGAVAAGTLTAQPGGPLPVHDPVPYFWSDQFGHKMQYVGWHMPGDRLAELPAAGRPGRTLAWSDGSDRVTAVLTIDRPHDSATARRVIAAGGSVDSVDWAPKAPRPVATD